MTTKLCIFACNSVAAEVSHVLQTGNYRDVKLQTYPISCVGSPLNNERILSITSKEEEYSKIIFFVSACQSKNAEKNALPSKIELVPLEQCFELILSKEIIYHYIQHGYYIISNGWLRNYKYHIKEWGFEESSAKVFFGESLQKILFLDSGIDQNYMPKLKIVSEYMGLPYDVLPVGLSHCRNYINAAVSSWRAEEERKYINEELSKTTKEHADYFFVFQQLQRLVDYTNEKQIVNEVFSLLNILFAPQQIVFQAYEDGQLFDSIRLTDYETNQQNNQADFMTIEIIHQNEILGVFEIYGIKFSNYIEQYKKIRPIISKICGVSISNARKYSSLEQAKIVISESEQRFHSLFDNMTEGVALHELEFLNKEPYDYRIIDVNKRYSEILGIESKQIVGKISTVAYQIEAPPYFDTYVEVVLNKKAVFFETYFASMDKHFAISAVPWQENGFATMFIDISDRKKNEDNLLKLLTAVEQSPISVVITDKNGNIEYGNQNVFNVTGYSPDEVLGKNPRMFKSGETPESEYKILWDTIISGKEWKGEFHNKKKNGELYWESATISTIKNENDEIINYLAIKEDVTNRKLAEEALIESEERYKLIAQNTLDVIFMIDATGKLLFFNESIEKVLGYKKEEVIDKSFTQFVPKSELPKYLLQLKNVFVKKEISGFFTKIYSKNGDILDVEINGKLIRHNKKLVALGTIRDISLRIKSELEIRQKNEELLKINSEKDKFFSIIAHDLKSPFNSIIGLSNILVQQVKHHDFDGIEKYAEIINMSSHRAMDLLKNLMEWALSQTGRTKFTPEYFEISNLIIEVEELLENASNQKSISITNEMPDILQVFADRNMISTVLRNLISNAIKFTHPGGKIKVTVKVHHNEIIVSIADSGVGISAERIKNLFRVGENESTPGTFKEKGTGLGLILCSEFVEKNGGKIWVESQDLKGSQFYFTLPLIG